MAKESIDSELNDTLVFYAKEVTAEVKKTAKEVAEQARKKIRDASPRKTGKYRRGWKLKKVFENANEVRYKIYNSRYQLTHLLEKGHLDRNKKGTVGPSPPEGHIEPNEKWAKEEFVRRVEKAVKQ